MPSSPPPPSVVAHAANNAQTNASALMSLIGRHRTNTEYEINDNLRINVQRTQISRSLLHTLHVQFGGLARDAAQRFLV